MLKTKIEQILREYDDFKPGDLVRLDVWFGRVLEHIQPDVYKVQFSTDDGYKVEEVSKDRLVISSPIEYSFVWNGCSPDLLTDEEWQEVKSNHPYQYLSSLKTVAAKTDEGSMLEDWIFEFLMSDKNPKKGKPEDVIRAVKNADYGSITKYMTPGEQLHDAIMRLWKEALYVSEDNRNVFMSY